MTLTVRGFRMAPRLCCVWLCWLLQWCLPPSLVVPFPLRFFRVHPLCFPFWRFFFWGLITGLGPCFVLMNLGDWDKEQFIAQVVFIKVTTQISSCYFSPPHAAENGLKIRSVRVLWEHHIFFIRLNIRIVLTCQFFCFSSHLMLRLCKRLVKRCHGNYTLGHHNWMTFDWHTTIWFLKSSLLELLDVNHMFFLSSGPGNTWPLNPRFSSFHWGHWKDAWSSTSVTLVRYRQTSLAGNRV